jgi:hypothetical protein
MIDPSETLVRESDVLQAALAHIRCRLPAGWSLEPAAGAKRRPDTIFSLTTEGGKTASFVAEVKRSLARRDLPAVREQLEAQIAALPPAASSSAIVAPLVVARYLSQPLQEWLTHLDIPYADATGNLRIRLSRPAMFLRDVGATKDPWRGPGRPKGNLTGEPAARVVRALVDFPPPYSVPRLIELAGTTTGPTYRVVDFLDEQALVTRTGRGLIDAVDWRKLLERWSQDFGFLRSNDVSRWLAPRGVDAVARALSTQTAISGVLYATTGSLAAQNWASYAPTRAVTIYSNDPHTLAEQLDLRSVDSGANVLLAKPAYDVVYARTTSVRGLVVVAPSQAVVDLLTGPGRNPGEAAALLDWMEANPDAWHF